MDHPTSPSSKPRKRARYSFASPWEAFASSSMNKGTPTTSSLSLLPDLFDGRRWLGVSGTNSKKLSPRVRNGGALTFRLEHRQGGTLATHPGEERILLFRSDLKGAIAKIIFSFTSPADDSDHSSVAHAKIHVLDVKEQYRGFDLGGLLFSEALRTLQDRGQPVCCELDAEEDVRRHNKLVGFYSQFGCTVKPNIKARILNNNDGETYRKVPMQIDLQATAAGVGGEFASADQPSCCLVKTTMQGFVPILLLGSKGREGKSDRMPRATANRRGTGTGRQQHWLMAQDGHGHVQFRTTMGQYLSIDSQGRCTEQDAESAGTYMSSFQLLRVPDCPAKGDDQRSPSENDLWMLVSHFGTFLYLDPVSLLLEGTDTPTFWHANSAELSLTCTSDTPLRRQFYRQSWIRQTVQFVKDSKKKYGRFQLGQMTLQEALRRVKERPGFPLRMDARHVSLRSVCFQTAEAARAAGHPDWVQFVALVHALAGVVHCLESDAGLAKHDDESDGYDWTIPCTSRIVGCASPTMATFAEFKDLNSDERDDRYNSQCGVYSAGCGLANVAMTWTGPEYLYSMLQHNEVDMPQEGFDVLRLFSQRDWHTIGLYEYLADDDDKEIQSFVADFDQLREHASQVCLSSPDVTDAECDHLWESHYAAIAAKFGADGVLDW